MADTGDNSEQGDAAFARGMSGPFGLYTEPVKTFIDPTTFEAWLRLCNSKNTTSSELLRDVMFLLVHGRTPAEYTAEDRRALLKGEGPNAALSRIGTQARS